MCHRPHVIHRELLNPEEYLGRGEPLTIGEELPPNVLADVGVAVESHEHCCLEHDLGALNVLVHKQSMLNFSSTLNGAKNLHRKIERGGRMGGEGN